MMKNFIFCLSLCIGFSCNSKKDANDLVMDEAHDVVVPEESNGQYFFRIENQELQIDPHIGGRVVSLKVDGQDFLTGKDVNEKYWGSTLWPSPQKAWGGTLSAELDNLPYSVSVEGNTLELVSQQDLQYGYVFTKEISANSHDQSFLFNYTITNASDTIQSVAPWEVTRVHPGGLTFFPKGTGERWGGMAELAEDIDGITWFTYREEEIPSRNPKFFSDGSEGWVAYLLDSVIFIKKFPDMPEDKAAPSEAEVEIYANPEKTYVEIEQQGVYETLQPGDSLQWEVSWYIRNLPSDLLSASGNSALVDFVRDVIN